MIGSRLPRSVIKKQKISINRESSIEYNRSTIGYRSVGAILALRPSRILLVTL